MKKFSAPQGPENPGALPRFTETYFQAPLSEVGDAAELDEDEAQHALKVLRLKPGQEVLATNGRGRIFRCRLETAGKAASVLATALEREEPDPPLLSLALCLLKGRDLEVPVEAVTQFKVRRIRVVVSDHGRSFDGQDHGRLLQRLRQKSLVSLKQAKKAWLTAVEGVEPLEAFAETAGTLITLAPGADRLPAFPPSRETWVLCGPEGGFSAREEGLLQAVPEGYRLSLGPTRLRAMHAPAFALGKLLGLGAIG